VPVHRYGSGPHSAGNANRDIHIPRPNRRGEAVVGVVGQLMGHGSRRIAAATGHPEHLIRKIVRGDLHTITSHLRDAVTVVYDLWWDKCPPQQTPADKTAARAALRRARAGGWYAGAALDDDLDAPGYQPGAGFRPADGTGIAPDITCRVRRTTNPAAIAAADDPQDPAAVVGRRDVGPGKETQIA
jgi:hypothetical protein